MLQVDTHCHKMLQVVTDRQATLQVDTNGQEDAKSSYRPSKRCCN